MTYTPRTFEDKPAVREAIPLLIGIMGPQGTGKTMSALELATGIVSVSGGEIFLVDTESRRGLHYAERYKKPDGSPGYRHIQFDPPHSSLACLDVINHCTHKGAGCIIFDSASHEHEGVGGLLEAHEAELDRMAGQDWKKREACQMAAWLRPKADHNKLRMAIARSSCRIIFCFRCKEGSKPIRGADGKTKVEHMGFTPIASPDLSYEMVAQILLLPQAKGLPTWRSDEIGEKLHMKLPAQFDGILNDGKPLSREHGRKLAEWARGSAPAEPDLATIGMQKANLGAEALKTWWEGLPVSVAKKAASQYLPTWKSIAVQVDAQQQVERTLFLQDAAMSDAFSDNQFREVEISHLSTGIITHPPRSNPTPEDMREIMSPEPIERKEAPAAAPPPQQQTIGEERL